MKKFFIGIDLGIKKNFSHLSFWKEKWKDKFYLV